MLNSSRRFQKVLEDSRKFQKFHEMEEVLRSWNGTFLNYLERIKFKKEFEKTSLPLMKDFVI